MTLQGLSTTCSAKNSRRVRDATVLLAVQACGSSSSADSTATISSTFAGTMRVYAGTAESNVESWTARICGGMHFDYATAAGVELGIRVAQQVGPHHLGRQS